MTFFFILLDSYIVLSNIELDAEISQTYGTQNEKKNSIPSQQFINNSENNFVNEIKQQLEKEQNEINHKKKQNEHNGNQKLFETTSTHYQQQSYSQNVDREFSSSHQFEQNIESNFSSSPREEHHQQNIKNNFSTHKQQNIENNFSPSPRQQNIDIEFSSQYNKQKQQHPQNINKNNSPQYAHADYTQNIDHEFSSSHKDEQNIEHLFSSSRRQQILNDHEKNIGNPFSFSPFHQQCHHKNVENDFSFQHGPNDYQKQQHLENEFFFPICT